jgi:hypothetical protein
MRLENEFGISKSQPQVADVEEFNLIACAGGLR